MIPHILHSEAENHAKELVDAVLASDALKEITQKAAEMVGEKIVEFVQDRLWDGCLENDMACRAHYMVETSVLAILANDERTIRQYALEGYRSNEARAAIAKLIPDQIAQARIADLEEKVAFLQKFIES